VFNGTEDIETYGFREMRHQKGQRLERTIQRYSRSCIQPGRKGHAGGIEWQATSFILMLIISKFIGNSSGSFQFVKVAACLIDKNHPPNRIAD